MAIVKRVTPVGTAYYPSLRSPEVFDGKATGYTCKLILNQDEITAFEEDVYAVLEEAKGLPEYHKFKWTNPFLPIGETKNGDRYIKFKAKHEYKDKVTGEFKPLTLAVFDKYGKPLSLDVIPSNGSKVQVSYTLTPYNTRLVCGVRADIKAVLVKELVTGNGGSAESHGFDIEKEVDIQEVDIDSDGDF